MAILKLFAMRDRQLNGFTRPFPMQSIGQATRGFRDEVNNRESDINKHPEDYELYHIGDFDDNTGKLITLPEPCQVALATNLIERKPDNIAKQH